MEIFLKVCVWLSVMITVSAVLPGTCAGAIAYSRSWSSRKLKNVARLLAGCLSVVWWFIAKYFLHMREPVAWAWEEVGTTAVIAAFFTWIGSINILAPRVSSLCARIRFLQDSR